MAGSRRNGASRRASDVPAGCERSAALAAHKPLVRRVAGRIRPRLPAHVSMDDLMQAGLIGLHEALMRYDAGQGACFETYASRRIEGAMLDELRANDTLSRDARARQREIRSAVHRLEHRLGRTPRAKEVSTELGWTLEAFHRAMVEAGAAGVRNGDEDLEAAERQIDELLPSAEPSTMVDEHADPLQALQVRQRHEALRKAFDALDERDRKVMEMLYERDLSLREIGAELGVSASRVSQLESEIVIKLKRRVRDW